MTGPPNLSGSAPAELGGGGHGQAIEPKASPRAGGTYGGHAGRKVVAISTTGPVGPTGPPSPDANAQSLTTQQASRPRRGKQTMEELDRRVAEDALALINMKREIIESQRQELSKAQQLLATLRKEHDTLHNANEKREKEINSIMDRARSLETVDRGVKAAGNATQEFANNMVKSIAHSDDLQAAEQRTLNMQKHMVNRLDAEIADLRILSSKATYRLDTLRHELVGTDTTLIVSKQELGEREQQLQKMNNNVNGLRKERGSKLGILQALIDDGEMSLSRVQGSVFDTMKGSPKSRGSRGTRTGTREGLSTARQEEAEDYENSENRPEIVAKRLSVEQVQEMAARYNSRGNRLEKLDRLESESKERIEFERVRRLSLQEQLDTVRDKMRALASTRQVYKEVDEKAKALAAARKTCDEFREMDVRLKANLESIRRSVPRFLSKITKAIVPMPTLGNLPDLVQKLEDEILKLFKATSAAMLKDATPEDLLLLSQTQPTSTPASESEIARLQKLPGFNKMQRTLFFNMMAAKPDNSDTNVRVEAAPSAKSRKDEASSQVRAVPGHLQLSLNMRSLDQQSSLAALDDDELGSPERPEEGGSLDRTTVKDISNLVIERDGGGWDKVLERLRAEEKQKEMLADRKRNKGKKRVLSTW